MSYILEALKKADQERGMGAVPSLATPQEVEHPRARTHRWPWVVVTLLLANAVLIAILLRNQDADAPVVVEAPLERPPAPVSEPSTQVIQQTSEAAIGKTPSSGNAGLPQKARPSSAGGLVVLPQPTNAQDSRPPQPSQKQPTPRAESRTSPQEVGRLQSWYELPPEPRSRLDLPRLDIHVYSEDPKDRFILVKLKKYREGEQLDSGLVLEEILPDGMVMSYQGERFLVDK